MNIEVRRNIQKSAAKLFLKYGLRSVSIDDICNDLRISKKTFYSYFPQKEALIESVLLEHDEKKFKKQLEKFKKFSNDGNRIDHIIAISSFHLVNSNNQFVNFFFDLSKYYPEIHKKQTMRSHNRACENIKEDILKGIEEGIFREDFDIDLMVNYISVQFMTIMNMGQIERVKDKQKILFEFLIDVYIRLLANEKGLEYYYSLKKDDKIFRDEKTNPPMGDEELELLIDEYLNSADEVIQSTFIK